MTKSSWLPLKGHAIIEVFLSQLEKELFRDDLDDPSQSNSLAGNGKHSEILLQITVLSSKVPIRVRQWLFGIGQTTY